MVSAFLIRFSYMSVILGCLLIFKSDMLTEPEFRGCVWNLLIGGLLSGTVYFTEGFCQYLYVFTPELARPPKRKPVIPLVGGLSIGS